MALGRKTGGRQLGTPNRTRKGSVIRRGIKPRPSDPPAIQMAINASNYLPDLMPLDFMLSVVRNPGYPYTHRADMAKSAAPYLHPRLATIDHRGNGGGIHLDIRQYIVHLDGRAPASNGGPAIEGEPIEDNSNGHDRSNGSGPAIKRYDE